MERFTPKPILIVDTLSIFSLVPIVLRSNLSKEVFYLRQGMGFLKHLMVMLFKRFGWSFEPIEYTMSSTGGRSLYRELSSLLIEKMKICREEIFPAHINKLIRVSSYERKRVSSCLTTLAGAELYYPMLLYLLSQHKFVSEYKVGAVLLKKTVFAKMISETYGNINLQAVFYSSFGQRGIPARQNYMMDEVVSRVIGSGFYRLAKTAALISFSLFSKLKGIFFASKKKIQKHKICAMVFNRQPSETISCLPWGSVQLGNLKKETLTLAPSYLSSSARQFYEERSDRYIEYSFNPYSNKKNRDLSEVYSSFIGYFFRNLKVYRRIFALRGIRGWITNYLLELLAHLSFFEAFFYVNGSKILWATAPDYTFMQMAAIAINRVGGVSLASTFSQSAFPEWEIHHNQIDVYFVWGRRLVEVLKGNEDQCKFFVIAGYPSDKIFAGEFKKAKELRDSIIKRYKVRNIVTFIDNAPGRDSFISPLTFLELYQEIFSWLEEDKKNFCIIKAKRSETIARQPRLKKPIDDFCQKGQLAVFYERAVIYPSWTADVVISPSLSLLCLSALSGQRCIYYDVHRSNEDYTLGLDNISIISQRGRIKEELRKAVGESRRNRRPQSLQPVKDSLIDPFVDGKAVDRIRGYFTDLINKFNCHSSNREAIDHANLEYKRQWGEDSVVRGPLSAD